jgi:hypothetical protein
MLGSVDCIDLRDLRNGVLPRRERVHGEYRDTDVVADLEEMMTEDIAITEQLEDRAKCHGICAEG